MVDFAEWDTWVVPLVMLLLVYSAFKEPIQDLIDGMADWANGTFNVDEAGFKPVAFSIIILLILIIGVSLAIYLHGAEPVNFKSVGARLVVIVVLFAMAWVVQETQAIFSITAIP